MLHNGLVRVANPANEGKPCNLPPLRPPPVALDSQLAGAGFPSSASVPSHCLSPSFALSPVSLGRPRALPLGSACCSLLQPVVHYGAWPCWMLKNVPANARNSAAPKVWKQRSHSTPPRPASRTPTSTPTMKYSTSLMNLSDSRQNLLTSQ